MTEPSSSLRIYPLGPPLTEEQIAVAFARSSRSPEPFDVIAQSVTETNAAQFHQRWVLDYGHASVAEHAVVHLAVENASRLAADRIESARLASYTEKSSRYQVISPRDYHVPDELSEPRLADEYRTALGSVFSAYQEMIDQNAADDATQSLLRRRLDAVRGVLPAATLTNLGVTANARSLENMASQLLSTDLSETHRVGELIRDQGRKVAPTLLKYADANPTLITRQKTPPEPTTERRDTSADANPPARLISCDPYAIFRLAVALLYRQSHDYEDATQQAIQIGENGRQNLIANALQSAGEHDPLPREFETIRYSLELTMDYGALREFRRHRMLTIISQPLTVRHGFQLPSAVAGSPMEKPFRKGVEQAEALFKRLLETEKPALAQYAVTHCHLQKILVELNLRELHHLIRLRTSPQAHESIRKPVRAMLEAIRAEQPELMKGWKSRTAPAS